MPKKGVTAHSVFSRCEGGLATIRTYSPSDQFFLGKACLGPAAGDLTDEMGWLKRAELACIRASIWIIPVDDEMPLRGNTDNSLYQQQFPTEWMAGDNEFTRLEGIRIHGWMEGTDEDLLSRR